MNRHTCPGVRFVPMATSGPVFESAVVTRADDHLAAHRFLRAVSRVLRSAPAAVGTSLADRDRAA
jgi:hypothetical protein